MFRPEFSCGFAFYPASRPRVPERVFYPIPKKRSFQKTLPGKKRGQMTILAVFPFGGGRHSFSNRGRAGGTPKKNFAEGGGQLHGG